MSPSGKAALVVGILLIASLLFSIANRREHRNNLASVAREARQDMIKSRALNAILIQDLELIDFTWSKPVPGLQMKASFKVRNKGKADLVRITIKCVHYNRVGTELDSFTRRLDEVVKAGETREFIDLHMGAPHEHAVKTVPEIILARLAAKRTKPDF